MTNVDYHILYNPISGFGSGNKMIRNVIKDFKNAKKSFTITKAERPGHIKNLCQNIPAKQNVIIIGGDGTFSEAINGLMLNLNYQTITIGFLPGGTGNSFMHDLNAQTYSKAFSLLLDNKTKKIDILKLSLTKNKEYALNIVGWGLVSDINLLSEKLRFLGSSRYTLASIYYIFRKKNRFAKITVDNNVQKGNFLFAMCLNTIHTGKGMKAAPNALLDDGKLDVILLESNISTWNLLILLPKLFTGEHVKSPFIRYIQAKKITIEPIEDSLLNIDGENKLQTPVSVSVLPQKINIFC